MARSRMLSLVDITVDLSIQQRTKVDQVIVGEYAAAMSRGDEFPPIVVYESKDSFWLSDGFHRVAAADAIELDKIKAEVREGTRKDAEVNACCANQGHGLRRTNEDKRRAVETLLRLFSGKSDRTIAEMAGVSDPSVAAVRGGLQKFSKPQQGGKPKPTHKSLAPIEEAMLADRDLIDADPKQVAKDLNVSAKDVSHVQETLEGNAREYKDGRKRYMPVFTKSKSPSYPATELFDKLTLSICSYHDQLAQTYAEHTERGFNYATLFKSEEWDDATNVMALNCIRETRKMITRFEKELERHVKAKA